MKRILVPTDFSPAADNALGYALQLGALSGAEVVAVHAVSLPLPEYAVQPEGIQEYNHYRVEEARLRLEALYARPDAGDKLTTVLLNGAMQELVPEKALQYDADLIVMGTRGADGLRTVLGTNAAEVLSRSAVPVLVIPDSYEGTLPRRMLLAVQHEENEFLLAPAFQLQALCGADLITLHIASEDTPVEKLEMRAMELELLATKWSHDYGTAAPASEVVSGTDFHAALNGFVRDQDIDMVVMVTHRKTGLPGRFQKSRTREQAFQTRVPLLSLHI
ncbi:MAG: hypothetical protein EOO08_10900 [Chitinophagaceae bacterium]|nr:MAG: hypothetical protein EOO08_10900 [Chitinophagaceae bacterium]